MEQKTRFRWGPRGVEVVSSQVLGRAPVRVESIRPREDRPPFVYQEQPQRSDELEARIKDQAYAAG